MILTYVFHRRRPRRPSIRGLLTEILQSLSTFIQEQRKMSQATDTLNTNVAKLQVTADAIVTKLNQPAPPPVIQGEDPVAVQKAADDVAVVDAKLNAALNPPVV